MLGVCLGHQCIGEAFGGKVVRAGRLMHGKTSPVMHDGKTIFAGLPNPFEAMRYHSLLVERDSMPRCLEVSARTAEGEIMGLRHREYRIEGVQFHPESIGTPRRQEICCGTFSTGSAHDHAAASVRRGAQGPLARRRRGRAVFGEILDDVVPDALVAGFLIALRLKGETAAELAGGSARDAQAGAPARPRRRRLLDTAGTGGDGAGTFNISTGAALVAAAAGVPVAKHGNRAISGRVGAADVLERLGVKLELRPRRAAQMPRAGGDLLRLCAGVSSGARAPRGVAADAGDAHAVQSDGAARQSGAAALPTARRRRAAACCVRLREALAALGVEHAMVVHGHDGLDEISLAAPTTVVEVRGKEAVRLRDRAGGLRRLAAARPADFADGGRRARRWSSLRRALAGEPGAAQDVLALKAGAAIYVGGGAASLAEGVALAREMIDSGRALETVAEAADASQRSGRREAR